MSQFAGHIITVEKLETADSDSPAESGRPLLLPATHFPCPILRIYSSSSSGCRPA